MQKLLELSDMSGIIQLPSSLSYGGTSLAALASCRNCRSGPCMGLLSAQVSYIHCCAADMMSPQKNLFLCAQLLINFLAPDVCPLHSGLLTSLTLHD